MINWWEDLSGFSGRIQDCDYLVVRPSPRSDTVHEHKNVIFWWENLSEVQRKVSWEDSSTDAGRRIPDCHNLAGESLQINAGGSKTVIIWQEDLSRWWREDLL